MNRVPADERLLEQVLDHAVAELESSGVAHAVMGGIAASALAGRRYTYDIDIFVRPEDADRALLALSGQGFSVERTDPNWLFKAKREGVTVDIIFRSTGAIYFDTEMIERSTRVDFRGRSLRVVAPEDLFIIKALVLNEHSLSLDEQAMRHLNDLLGIVRWRDLDWNYLLKRARMGPRRVLGLPLYAQSLDLVVPNRVLTSLAHTLELC